MTTTVARRRRSGGWRAPAGSVVVDRSTLSRDRTRGWGNQLVVGRLIGECLPELEVAADLVVTPIRAEQWFEYFVRHSSHPQAVWIRAHVHELAGKVLLCWCAEGAPCHARVLARLADEAVALRVSLDALVEGAVAMGVALEALELDRRVALEGTRAESAAALRRLGSTVGARIRESIVAVRSALEATFPGLVLDPVSPIVVGSSDGQ